MRGRNLKIRDEVLEEIRGLLNEAEDRVDVILVEGRHDERTLSRLGYRGKVIRISSFKKSLVELAEYISNKYEAALILTDFDRYGDALASRLTQILRENGVKVEEGLRAAFSRIMSRLHLATVEELYTMAPDLEGGFGPLGR